MSEATLLNAELVRALDENRRLRDEVTILRRKAYFDGLTELYRRETFLDLAGEFIDRLSTGRLRADDPRPETVALVMLDLIDFGKINDVEGHLAGDKVLAKAASGIRRRMRGQSDWYCRYGGDEFLVLLKGVTREQTERVIADINRNMKEEDARLIARAAIEFYQHGDTLASMLERVDRGMIAQKGAMLRS